MSLNLSQRAVALLSSQSPGQEVRPASWKEKQISSANVLAPFCLFIFIKLIIENFDIYLTSRDFFLSGLIFGVSWTLV